MFICLICNFKWHTGGVCPNPAHQELVEMVELQPPPFGAPGFNHEKIELKPIHADMELNN
jgi:hypothetical protein